MYLLNPFARQPYDSTNLSRDKKGKEIEWRKKIAKTNNCSSNWTPSGFIKWRLIYRSETNQETRHDMPIQLSSTQRRQKSLDGTHREVTFLITRTRYIQPKPSEQNTTQLTLRRLMSYIYIYGAPILDVSRSHTTTQHSR